VLALLLQITLSRIVLELLLQITLYPIKRACATTANHSLSRACATTANHSFSNRACATAANHSLSHRIVLALLLQITLHLGGFPELLRA